MRTCVSPNTIKVLKKIEVLTPSFTETELVVGKSTEEKLKCSLPNVHSGIRPLNSPPQLKAIITISIWRRVKKTFHYLVNPKWKLLSEIEFRKIIQIVSNSFCSRSESCSSGDKINWRKSSSLFDLPYIRAYAFHFPCFFHEERIPWEYSITWLLLKQLREREILRFTYCLAGNAHSPTTHTVYLSTTTIHIWCPSPRC